MEEIQLVLGLLVVVALIATVARRLGVPYAIPMLLGGLLLGLIPGLPRVTLTPDLVLLIFLPPILFSAAYATSVRDLRANIKQIGQLAFVLVLLKIRHEVIQVERLAVIRMRDVGEINDEVLHRLERELYLEELRMDA